MTPYERIARAIAYISDNSEAQPSLEAIASYVHLSPFHFQRLFCRWAGTTPKRFLQVLTLERSKRLLEASTSLLDLTNAIGLSSGSRLHDHFVHIEAVTPGEYRTGGSGLDIEYGIHPTPFGDMFIAVTKRGICRAAFTDSGDARAALSELVQAWPQAAITRNDPATRYVAEAVSEGGACGRPLSLQVSGTNFQLAVWRAMLRVPPGTCATYGQIAMALGRPRAARAVGNAVAANPVAFIIPCHRAILSSGALGDYRWSVNRKRTIQVWESSRSDSRK